MSTLAAQRDRWILWLPAGAMFGAAAYIGAAATPPAWLAPGVFVGGLGLACVFAFWPSPTRGGVWAGARAVLAGLFALMSAFGLGAGAGQIRSWSVAQPALTVTEEARRIEGWVAAVEPGERGPRLRLLVRAIAGTETPPRYVRISVARAGVLAPGRAAVCVAELRAPAPLLSPGGYDFARRAYFERLAGTGFAYGRCRVGAFPPPESVTDRARLRLAAMRQDVSNAIQARAPGRGGAIAAALVTGDRGAVDEASDAALRDSGLGHLLSVSGVHMAVVGGVVFAGVLWALSLIPPIALRVPVKKIAAATALIALALYLLISGTSVPAIRAFVMALVAFGAILIDRPAISMRGLGLAALIIVLVFPESVLEPGFQMSFAATLALVALFERTGERKEPQLPSPGLIIGAMQSTMRGMSGVIGVSLVAGLATDPFALYHFQRFSAYALIANLAAAPIMTFVVAPAAAVAALLAPFDAAGPALAVMAGGLDLITAIGEVFASRPEAVRALAQPPASALLACVVAMLWACLWRGPLRWGGLVFFALSIWLYANAPRPVLAFDSDLRAVFARAQEAGGGERWTLLSLGRSSDFARERLGAQLGLTPARAETLAPPESCELAVCVWTSPGGRPMALVFEAAGFERACLGEALVFTRAPPPSDFIARCGIHALIDARDLDRFGGGFVHESAEGFRLSRANPARAQGSQARPWTPEGWRQE